MSEMAKIPSMKIVGAVLAYNCGRMFKRTSERIPKHLLSETIVFDDGSKDNTSEVAKGYGYRVIKNPTNFGYGGNLKSALKLAFSEGADYVVEIHGDGAQFNPIALKDALPLMEKGYDLILGSRFIYPAKALKNGMPLIRFVANRFLSFFDKLVLKLPLTEFHTGFRIYSRRLFETLPFTETSDNYLFSFEVIAQSAYYSLKVAEVEVEADYRSEHTSHKLSGAAVYALNSFVILGRFLLARYGLYYSRLFPNLSTTAEKALQRSV